MIDMIRVAQQSFACYATEIDALAGDIAREFPTMPLGEILYNTLMLMEFDI